MTWLTEACAQRSPFLGYVDVEPAMRALLGSCLQCPAADTRVRGRRKHPADGTLLTGPYCRGIGASSASHLYSCWISRSNGGIRAPPLSLLVMTTTP